MQGVGFRWHVSERARRLGLGGWVKNRLDGAVEICAAGPQEALDQLESHILRGPEGAEIQEVERVTGSDLADIFKPFSIDRGR